MSNVPMYAPTIGTHNSQHVVCFLQMLTKWVVFLLWFALFLIGWFTLASFLALPTKASILCLYSL
jgi:hypothetical protein